MSKREHFRWCPKCKVLHHAIWEKCAVCKTPLISSFWRVPFFLFRLSFFLIKIVFILALFCFGIYLTQESEGRLYQRSFNCLKAGHYQDAWNGFEKALERNPAVRWVKGCLDGTGGMSGGISIPENGSVDSSGQRMFRIVPGPPVVFSKPYSSPLSFTRKIIHHARTTNRFPDFGILIIIGLLFALLIGLLNGT